MGVSGYLFEAREDFEAVDVGYEYIRDDQICRGFVQEEERVFGTLR